MVHGRKGARVDEKPSTGAIFRADAFGRVEQSAFVLSRLGKSRFPALLDMAGSVPLFQQLSKNQPKVKSLTFTSKMSDLLFDFRPPLAEHLKLVCAGLCRKTEEVCMQILSPCIDCLCPGRLPDPQPFGQLL
jgi:hypothetical protein